MVSVVRRYYLYRATLSSGFYIPVSVVYMETRGLGLADIGLAQGAFLFSMVLSELPTGYLGDRLGRRTALALGNGIVVVVMVGFALADSPLDFVAVYAFWAVGVPVAGLGVLYAGFKLVAAACASAAGPVEDSLGTHGTLLLVAPVVGVLYASFAVVPLLLIPAMFARRGIQRITRPVRNRYINDRLSDVGRATVLSGVSMSLTLVSGVANVLGGHAASAVGPVTFLAATGVAVSVLGGLLWVATHPVRPPTGDPVPS